MGFKDVAKCINAKFENLIRALKLWAEGLSCLKRKIADINDVIFLFDLFEEFRDLGIYEGNCKAFLKDHFLVLLNNQRIYWKQRGKIKGVKFRDENTKFFHTKASINHRHHHIAILQNEDQTDIFDHAGKATILWDAFRKRLGVSKEGSFEEDNSKF